MQANKIRELLHDMCNKLVAIDVSIQSIKPEDVAPHAQEHYRCLKENVEGIKQALYEAHSAIHDMLHKHYPEYTGEPPLLDRNNVQLKMGDPVEVPSPKAADMWGNSFAGTIISTTRGDGLICVRDQEDDCWDIEANRVTKL